MGKSAKVANLGGRLHAVNVKVTPSGRLTVGSSLLWWFVPPKINHFVEPFFRALVHLPEIKTLLERPT